MVGLDGAKFKTHLVLEAIAKPSLLKSCCRDAHSCQKMILIALRLSFEVAHHTLSIYYIHHQYPFYKCLHKNWKGLVWKRRPLLSCNVYYRRWLFPPYVGSAAVHFSESIFAAWPKKPLQYSVGCRGNIFLGVWAQT